MKTTQVTPLLRVFACGTLLTLPILVSAQQQPRELSEQELEKLHQSVKKSKVRTEAQVRDDAIRAEQLAEQTRQEIAQMDEDARRANEQRAAQEARDDAEREAESRQLRESFAAAREKSERALEESINNLRESAARDNAMMAEARAQAQQGAPVQGYTQSAPEPQSEAPSAVLAEESASNAGAGDSSDGPPSNEAPATAPGKDLRFVLDIGLVNKPGDSVNPTCYSNVITRPGPPGWGGSGFLPDGSAEQAQQEVESLRDSFIAACRATGREVTSEGNFHWTWNQNSGGDQQVSNAHARYPEDVSVSL